MMLMHRFCRPSSHDRKLEISIVVAFAYSTEITEDSI